MRPIARIVAPFERISKSAAVTGCTRTVWRTHSGTACDGDVGDRAPALEHDLGREPREIRQQEEVGLIPRGHRAEVAEAMPLSRVERRHDDGVLGSDAARDGLADHPVDVAVLGDVLRVAIIGAERDPARTVLRRKRQQRLQVARHRCLTDEQPHAGLQPLAPLVRGQHS